MTEKPKRIFFEPGGEPGTDGTGPDGESVRLVSPSEYFVALLSWRWNATMVFLSIGSSGSLSPEEMAKVDDAVALAYWDEYGGILTSSRIRSLVRACMSSASGTYWIHQVENLADSMTESEDLEAATELHAVARVEALLDGVDGRVSELQVAASEFMADYLLLQKAIMLDIRTAESRRAPGQTRHAMLEEMDRSADLALEKAMVTIHKPGLIADAIPSSRRPAIERFARSRDSIASSGLFARVEAGQGSF